MFKGFNKLEKAWIYYDIGNSAFTMMVSTLIPILFNTLSTSSGLSDSQYLAYWSYATSLATICVAILGPILGTISDNKGFKKPMFRTVLYIGVIGCILMGIIPYWFLFLVTYLISKVAYQSSIVLYDSMLTDVTTPERMDSVSSQGYAWGYIGSCIPFIIALAFYMMGSMFEIIPTTVGFAVGFFVTGIWWYAVSIPLLRNYEQKYYVETSKGKIKESFARLGRTLSHITKEEKKVFYFLLGFFFYIDGVYTIIDEAVAIGTALGLDEVGLLIILLGTQVVAFVFATIFGKLSEKYHATKLIKVCIAGYFCVAVYALFLGESLLRFAIMAFMVGMFQGAIQALSRSYFAQIIPADNSGEYFGLYDICGKGAAFLGTTMIGVVVSMTNSINIAVGTLAILFVLGAFFFHKSGQL